MKYPIIHGEISAIDITGVKNPEELLHNPVILCLSDDGKRSIPLYQRKDWCNPATLNCLSRHYADEFPFLTDQYEIDLKCADSMFYEIDPSHRQILHHHFKQNRGLSFAVCIFDSLIEADSHSELLKNVYILFF